MVKEVLVLTAAKNVDFIKVSILGEDEVKVSSSLSVFNQPEGKELAFNSVEVTENSVFAGKNGAVLCFPFSESIRSENTLDLIDQDSEGVRKIPNFLDRVMCVNQWNSEQVLTASSNAIKMCSTKNLSCLKEYSGEEGHTDTVYCVPRASENTFCSCSNDRKLKVWDVEKGLIMTIHGHEGFAFGCDYSMEDNILFSGGSDNYAKMWDIRTKTTEHKSIHSVKAERSLYSCLCASKYNKYYFGMTSGYIAIIDMRMPDSLFAESQVQSSWVNKMRIMDEGRLLASGSDDGTMTICDSNTLEKRASKADLGAVADLRVIDHVMMRNREMAKKDEDERVHFLLEEFEKVEEFRFEFGGSKFSVHKVLLV